MNGKRLAMIRKAIENHKENFNMLNFHSGPYNPGHISPSNPWECGTAHCIGGFTDVLFHKLYLKYHAVPLEKKGKFPYDFEQRKILGISIEQSDDLFYPDKETTKIWEHIYTKKYFGYSSIAGYSSITVEQAQKAIDNLVYRQGSKKAIDDYEKELAR